MSDLTETNNGNGKVKLEKRLTGLEKDVEFIKKQVSNHLPHQITKMGEEIAEAIKGHTEACEKQFAKKWIEWVVTVALGAILTGLIGGAIYLLYNH